MMLFSSIAAQREISTFFSFVANFTDALSAV